MWKKWLEIHQLHFHWLFSGTTWGSQFGNPWPWVQVDYIFTGWPWHGVHVDKHLPCWNALERDPESMSAAGGAALSLTPTSELPGLVEKRWKNFPAGINKIISLKHCNTFLAWVVLVGITHPGFSRPELVTIYSISLCICVNEPRAVQETSMEEKQEEAPPGWYVNMSFWKVSCLYLSDLCCRSSRICDTVHCYSIAYNVGPSTTSCLHGFQ